jgi:methylated-DNA-[protein]-cysteine S-methyltransferase
MMKALASASLPHDAVLDAPFGRIGVRTRGNCVVGIAYLGADAPLLLPCNSLAAEACAQINAYLVDPGQRFDLPFELDGSAFQQQVWHAIAAIPCGSTRTYGELALSLRSAPRPVGNACGSNPVPLIVPCHRVVAAGGGLGGFMHSRAAGAVSIKRWLLQHERGR